MSHYFRDYSSPAKTREQHDEQAIADMMEYLSPKQRDAVQEMIDDPACTVQHINFGLGFAGVSGRPFFALMRKHRLAEFREWCAKPSSGGSRETDEQGFFIDGE